MREGGGTVSTDESTTEAARLYSEAILIELDRTLWSYPFSELTEERAKRVFVICAGSLPWAAGLVKEESIKFMDLEIGASAVIVTWVTLGLVVYCFAQWWISMRRDRKHWRLSISGVNQTLRKQASAALAGPQQEIAERKARWEKYAPTVKEIEEQLAALKAEYRERTTEAAARSNRAGDALSDALRKAELPLTEQERTRHRDLGDEAEDALQAHRDLEDELYSREVILERKRAWYLARSRVPDETVRKVIATLTSQQHDQLEAVLRGGKGIDQASLVVETGPVCIVTIAAVVWPAVNAVRLSEPVRIFVFEA